MVTRSLCLCVFSPGCRSLGHPGCRCFSGSLPRSASCFMRSYCISHRVTYLLFLSHTLIHAHTHTHPPFLLGLAVTVSTGQVLTTPPNSSFASSFFFFHFELHVAVAFFFFRRFFLYASAHTAGCVFLMRHGSVKAFSMWLTSVNISNYAVNSVISNSLCMFTEKVLAQLQTQGCIPDSLPRSCLFPSVHHAVQHCLTILPRSLEVRTIDR